MDDRRVVLGLGATKAGSSWLYRYLRGHPDCHLRHVKELHFFDVLDRGHTPARLRRLHSVGKAMASNPTPKLAHLAYFEDLHDWIGVAQSERDVDYLNYLSRGAKQGQLLGDITPGYALVSEPMLERMSKLTQDVRFVYFMRDPVARLWSHARMLVRERAKGAEQARIRAGRVVNRVLSGGELDLAQRGDYKSVLTRLSNVVDPKRLFLGFFEELVSGAIIQRLCEFLGIAPQPAQVEKKVHEGIRVSMSDDQKNRAAAFLRPQYEFVRSRMGYLPPAWDANLARAAV